MNTRYKAIPILLLLSFFALASWAAPKPFTVTATIKGLPEGTKVKLVPGATHADEQPIAEAIVKSGNVVFKGTLEGPRLCYIQVSDAFGGATLMLEPGSIELTATAEEIKRGNDKGYNFKDVNITGSKLHAFYLEKKSPKEKLNALYEANAVKHKEVSALRYTAMTMKDTVAVAEITKSAAWKSWRQMTSTFSS